MFQVCNSMLHHLNIVLYAHHPWSSVLPTAQIEPFNPLHSLPTPSSLVTTLMLWLILLDGEGNPDTQGTKPCEDHSRHWSEASTNQETPGLPATNRSENK